MSRPEIPECLAHFLLVGCWRGSGTGDEKFETFMLSMNVLRNRLGGLRRAWRDLGPALKARQRGGETFAEMALRVGDFLKWPDTFGRMACEEHREAGRRDA